MKKRQAKKLAGRAVDWRKLRGTHADTGGGLRFKRRLRRLGTGWRGRFVWKPGDVQVV